MIPKQAIELAIEGGWRPFKSISREPLGGRWEEYGHIWAFYFDDEVHHTPTAQIYKERIVLDPIFWSSLGKALGWGNSEILENAEPLPHWRLRAIGFFDLILTGGDVEKFWDEILSTNEKE